MILYYLWRRRLWRRLDRDKWRFFAGRTRDELNLSRAYPPWRALRLRDLLFSPAYAAAAAAWIEYRIELYDGLRG